MILKNCIISVKSVRFAYREKPDYHGTENMKAIIYQSHSLY